MRRAFVTGITGQDGGYLAERLVAEGVEVHGLVLNADDALRELQTRVAGVVVHVGDLADHERLSGLVDEIEPDEVYNLAGVSSVAFSWEQPVVTVELSGVAAVVLLDAAWRSQERTGRQISFVQASSAEIFGPGDGSPRGELTAVSPANPYGAAKAYAHQMAAIYRGRGLRVASCILFNHESPRRPTTFVSRKITADAARIGLEGTGTIRLGNLDARRDWGWAPDYVEAMIRAARHSTGEDFVIATGTAHSVGQFAEAALRRVGLGEDWRQHVAVDPELLRPSDADVQVGDASKARELLGWEPTITFDEIVGRMVDHDVDLLRARA